MRENARVGNVSSDVLYFRPMIRRLLSFGALLAAAPLASALTDKPNIVFILIDDMGWADIAADGSRYYRTPNIDRLAAQGVRFTDGYASCAVCSPSRAALMTGRSPARLHITDWIPGEGANKKGAFDLPKWTQSLDPAIPNLPTALHKLGYATASIGKWHLGGKGHLPEDCGFDLNIAGGHTGHPASYFWPYGEPGASHRVPMLAERGGKKGEFLTDRLTDEAIGFIDANAKKPFFLYLAHYAVHDPIMGKPEDIEGFKDTPPADGQKSPVYAALVKSVDDSVGRLMAELDRLGVTDNTVVVFTSDNGGAIHLGKNATRIHPLRGGKGFPYEGGLRVPLVVRAPGVTPPGTVSDAPVITADFFPTLVSLAHGRVDTPVDGRDVTPELRGAKPGPRTLGWNYPHYWAGGMISPYAALRDGDWKIIRWHEYGVQELFDLAHDPSEKNDLAATNPDKMKAMSAKLDAWLKDNDAQLPTRKTGAAGTLKTTPNPASADKWRN